MLLFFDCSLKHSQGLTMDTDTAVMSISQAPYQGRHLDGARHVFVGNRAIIGERRTAGQAGE